MPKTCLENNASVCLFHYCKKYGKCVFSHVKGNQAMIMGAMIPKQKRAKPINLVKSKKLQVFRKTKGLCWLCERPIEFNSDFSIDHVIPKSRGGSNSIENLLPAHRICNIKKSSHEIKTSDEFKKMFGL